MFKFIIIEPHHKKFDDSNLSTFVKKLRSIERKNISPNRTFILCSHDRHILGGASLLQKNLAVIQEDLQPLVPAFTPHSDYVWECSRIHLENLSAPTDLPLLQSFYRTLYEGLAAFAKQKGIGFIIMKLVANAYRASQKYGLWPYVVELRPENSVDALFHGILPLHGKLYESYLEMQPITNILEIKEDRRENFMITAYAKTQ